ncbi:conserved hypothetical protein [Uncinocarpus reesii 1704]|uniref:Nicotinamide riboside kinase n=1 Tax=Uncinocarpus reesii (strain UAMH 1704) TaxID=336963 RepID=C4JRL8_UNCRE|nr:uncharacterized protein UREG_05107 [Uncinocarpus reesii 1704]EEP80265.1 conserved hypothetical protein [Uncinocarpus reesii 1704]
MDIQREKTLLVGLSGPSSSGKTTLARLLRTVFTPPSKDHTPPTAATIRPFVLHEDDFYKPDDQIPLVTTSSGKVVQDWDTIEALDVPQFEATLAYIRDHGHLPAGLKSKEDLNDATDSGVDKQTLHTLRDKVSQRTRDLVLRKQRRNSDGFENLEETSCSVAIAFVDGFLLYAPPNSPSHPLRTVHDIIDVPLFLPATYTLLKQRRESRTGYVTIGPAPTPKPPSQGDDDTRGADKRVKKDADEYIPPETNFWTDPPGYVDDIVWPRYITDHSWLLLPEASQPCEDIEDLKRLVGEGRYIRDDMGVLVAPGSGGYPMVDLLQWAVDEVLKGVENMLI